MDTNTDEQILPVKTEDNGDDSRDDRSTKPLVWNDSRWMAIISIFCIGLLWGFGGGFLLGGTSIVLLQSVELLADNRQFMDKLHMYKDMPMAKYLFGIDKEESVNNTGVVLLHTFLITMTFCFFSSILSVSTGLSIGLSTYSLGIEKYSQAAKGKALSVAGPVCLMVTTATGYLLGFAFESFVSTLTLKFFIYSFLAFLLLFIIFCCLYFSGVSFSIPSSQIVKFLIFFLRKILEVFCIPEVLARKSNIINSILTAVHSVFIGVAIILPDHSVVFQSPTLNDTDSLVLQVVLAGVFFFHLRAFTTGSLLFVFWQSGGAFTVCATAFASGTAILNVIKLVLPSLGPGPSIGALTGVAGAAGVSLSAAGAATDQYSKAGDHCGFSGRLGVAVGAAVGAALSTCTHSGLLGLLMSLCAATIPATDFAKTHLPSSY